MITDRTLPQEYLDLIASLEQSYLENEDPILQSGFGGGPERWQAERSPILEAIETDGDLIDIGCANGHLLKCLTEWAGERGITLTPHGLDYGTRLIELAREQFPDYRLNFYVGNAWDWDPPRQFRYVYTLYDCVPVDYLEEYVHRLLQRAVEPGGRLIVGAYGSRSRGLAPFDIAAFLGSAGFAVTGTTEGGHPPITQFAWLDNVK
jgi:SAM-dependent methyltransferase